MAGTVYCKDCIHLKSRTDDKEGVTYHGCDIEPIITFDWYGDHTTYRNPSVKNQNMDCLDFTQRTIVLDTTVDEEI
jgi:hypothetical protein